MTLYEQLEGNGLIVFSDPASAKSCLSVAKILSRIAPEKKVTLVSNKSYPFYANWRLPVDIVDAPAAALPKDIKWVLTGSSQPETSGRFELSYLRLASEEGVPSFSLLDDMPAMAQRFQDAGGNFTLPGKLIVSDENARKLAINQGIPSSIIKIYNDPYLDYIETYWRPKLRPSAFRKLLHIDSRIPIVLFAPNPLTLCGDANAIGFDEEQVLQELLQITAPYKCHVLVKAHPLQPVSPLEKVIQNNPKARVTLITDQWDNLDLTANSTITIGYFSNLLLEASALGKNIIRYFNKAMKEVTDPVKTGEAVYCLESFKRALVPKIR